MINLSDLRTEKLAEGGAVLQLRHPTTKEPLDGFTLTLKGSDSKEYRDAVNKVKRAYASKKRSIEDNLQMIDDLSIETIIACTVDWTLYENGKAIPFSKEKARELYSDPYLDFDKQAAEFIQDRANFLPKA